MPNYLKIGLAVCGSILGITQCLAAELQLRSVPEGAIIVERETGKQYRTPINLSYVLDERIRDQSGCYLVKGFTAIWESGARADTQTITLCGAGPVWNFQFFRPQSAPGASVDYAYESRLNQKGNSSNLTGYLIGSFLKGYLGGGGRSTYVPPPIPSNPALYPQPSQPTSTSSGGGWQITPGGTYVSGDRPVSICPDGSYVAGNCTITPDGKFIGQ